MSGHSKWSQIKHKKGATDQKRSALFSKLLKAIVVAARDNPDLHSSPRLKGAIEIARKNNVPNENIERALKKSKETDNLIEVIIEAYGPEKSAFLIEGITDNTNRTISEVKNIIQKAGAKPADPGSVLWSFQKGDMGWEPNFTQPVSKEGEKKIKIIAQQIEDHPDIQKVTINI